MNDRYNLQRSIVYVQAVMICSEAGRRMEKRPADGALVGRPPPVLLVMPLVCCLCFAFSSAFQFYAAMCFQVGCASHWPM